jgi:hypothetical protein
MDADRPIVAVLGAIVANLNVRLNKTITANCLLASCRTHTVVFIQSASKVTLFFTLLDKAVTAGRINTVIKTAVGVINVSVIALLAGIKKTIAA